ncbi:MAG: FtsX-like permease family protein, partial [Dehalococcoidia bacterium]
VSLENYDQYLRRLSGGQPNPPTEFWLALDDEADREQTIAQVRERLPRITSVRDRDAVVERSQRNPLAGGGWNGLTLLSLATLTVAVVLALGTHAAIAVRSGRVDLTVARALGFSKLQIMGSLALERIVVAVVGLIAGVVIGLILGQWVLGFLDQTASGREVLPPMVLLVQQWIVALVVLSLGVAALLAILFATLSAGRLKPSDILRTGE